MNIVLQRGEQKQIANNIQAKNSIQLLVTDTHRGLHNHTCSQGENSHSTVDGSKEFKLGSLNAKANSASCETLL